MATGKARKSDAIKFAEELAASGRFTMAPTLKEYGEFFWNSPANGRGLSVGTRKLKISSMAVMVRELGHMSLTQLTTEFLEDYFQELLNDPDPKRRRSKNTIQNNYIGSLSGLFDKAVRDHILINNPIRGITLVGEEGKREAFSNQEIHELFFVKSWDDELLQAGSLLSASTGLRLGEVQALQVKHLIYMKKTNLMVIKVEQSFKLADRSIGRPKTKAGVRYVPVGEAMMAWLKSRAVEKFDELSNASVFREPDFFLFSLDGRRETIIGQEKFRECLDRNFESFLGYTRPKVKSFHSFRHWYNTRMLILTHHNEPLVKALMGHGSKDNMTLNYMSSTPDKLLEVVPLLNQLFGTTVTEEIEGEENVEVGVAFGGDDARPLGADNF